MTTTTCFVSSLAPHFQAYLALMRAVGRRYNRVERILLQLDHFVAKEPPGDVLLSRDLLERWLASTPHLAPSTLRCHASAARQFCRYLARTEPRTWIPDRSLYPAHVPQFRPYVFSASEVRDLLAAAQRLPSKRWPLGPQTFFRTALAVVRNRASYQRSPWARDW
jgi:integrase/recombinase XerD